MPAAKEGKKKEKNKFYFGEETDLAIVEYQLELSKENPSPEILQKIFVSRIQPAFEKLVENLIFVYKFHTLGEIDVLKDDCISFLVENIHKFDKSRGKKAFSYFNVMGKHWFIQEVKKRKRKNKLNVSFDKTAIKSLEKDNNDAVVFSLEDVIFNKEFIENLKEEMSKWRDKFHKDQEVKVLEAILLLFENPDLVPIYNKKAIYFYIREISGLNTKQVVTNLGKFKKKYSLFKKKYLAGEI